jgi:hypothetical protein
MNLKENPNPLPLPNHIGGRRKKKACRRATRKRR